MDCSATGIAMLHTFLKKAQLCLIFSCYLKANTTSISTGDIHGITGKEVFYIQGEQQPDIFYISLLQTTPANAGVATGERGYMERAMAYPGPLGSNLLLSGSGLSCCLFISHFNWCGLLFRSVYFRANLCHRLPDLTLP